MFVLSRRTKWETALSGGVKKEPAYKRNVSYEDKVANVKAVQAKYPNATRTTITNWTGYKSTILNDMEAKGDIKLPPKKKTTSKTTPWMKNMGKLSG